MTRLSRVIFLLISFIVARSQIYLHHTNDGFNIEQYDCVIVQSSLSYCRRPIEPINLTREDNETLSCVHNGGEMHRFSDLRSKNITTKTLQHQWTITLETVEEYSLYLKDLRLSDGHLCRCLHLGAFGKNCEYQLSVGETFEETLEWQLIVREGNQQEVHIYGDIVCYETLRCNSGVLCLDWREICDGIQQYLEGKDEENCDLLEMNRCDPEDEYRCMNGMCIPQEFFLDGDLDCLDWSDEIPFKDCATCASESVTTQCDDRVCPLNEWSCGDGQCIRDRLKFQKSTFFRTCSSGRDQYFMCATHVIEGQWTMGNGRCYRGKGYKGSTVANRSDEEMCKYLLECTLSWGGEIGCPCNDDPGCADELERVCLPSLLQSPGDAIVTPYTFFFYNTRRYWQYRLPQLTVIDGTVRCRGSLVTVIKGIPFDLNLNVRRLMEEHFCQSSLSENVHIHQECHHENESTDRCEEWNRCLSVTRINDGWSNCINGRDERDQTQVEIEQSCARVRRHRFRCSREQATCLIVTRLGDGLDQCLDGRDEFWFGVGRTLSSINCNSQRQGQCSLLRQYIEQSWKPFHDNEARSKVRIPFRSYCDTFANLETREDENPRECQQRWVCPQDQWQCGTGQCVEPDWLGDAEWDCEDASDEHESLKFIAQWIREQASRHDFSNRSYFVPSNCSEHSDPFLCLSSDAEQQGFSCFNLTQISDHHIDCAGGMDEQKTLQHCSRSSKLEFHFLCPSTNSCIPYYLHCWEENRCPNRSDDEFWCERQNQPAGCLNRDDFVCFDGRCLKGGRCNWNLECPFGEDEYMCDYWSSHQNTLIPYRQLKRSTQGTRTNTLRFFPYPTDANITQLHSYSLTTVPPANTNNSNNFSSFSLSPFWCNRALGVHMINKRTTKNHSTIVCFCPPQYHGAYCQYQTDRLSVLLHLDLSQSSYLIDFDPRILLKLVVLFIFNAEVLERDQFHLHPSSQISETLNEKKKFISHFVYRRSFLALEQRRQRFFNRSSLLDDHHPFTIRIELYQTSLNEEPSMIGVWKYPLPFDHLLVTRLAKVLRLSTSSFDHRRNPCSSHPCHPDERCHPLMNDRSQHICLCPTNFTGENCSRRDPRCDPQGYCLQGSLCQPDRSRSSLPFCVCPSNRYGRRCSIEHDLCLFNPCLHNGSCLPNFQPDRVICLCTKEYSGSRCQWKRVSIDLSLSIDLPYLGVVIQFFEIDTSSFDLLPLDQQVFKTLPQHIEYYHRDQTKMTGIVLAKLYSSEDENSSADLHLLSVYVDIFSLRGTTEISQINRCAHRRSSRVHSSSSPIRYHHICRENVDLLCFRDDVYLCLCSNNHTRVECFPYNDELDRCPYCLAEGRCLKGNLRRSNNFVCLCPACHSGRECQFNTKSFSFTLDQLFSLDLLSDERQTITMSLLLFFSLLVSVLGLPNNLFSLLTLRRPSCLRHGVGHYLRAMSVINQLSLSLLVVRLVHLIVNITGKSSSSSKTNDLLCKSLNYFLSSSIRLVYWLTSLISIERLYSTLSLRGQWLKKPRIACRLIVLIFFGVLISNLYELFFYRSFSTQIDGIQGSMCVLQIPASDRSLWMTFHLLFLILHSFVPFLINLCSTIIITFVVINKKINTHGADQVSQSTWMNIRGRFRLIVDVLSENKEFVMGPAITVVPQLFSLPLLISSFVFDCYNLEESWLRYFLIVSYWISFTPQWTSFFLYIVPSSLYSNEWRRTNVGQWINNLRRQQTSAQITTTFNSLSVSAMRDMVKGKH